MGLFVATEALVVSLDQLDVMLLGVLCALSHIQQGPGHLHLYGISYAIVHRTLASTEAVEGVEVETGPLLRGFVVDEACAQLVVGGNE